MYGLVVIVWIGKSYLLKQNTVNIISINFFISGMTSLFICLKLLVAMRTQCFTTINIAGHLKKTQNSLIIEAILNLISSIILVNIYGVVLGSIIAMIYRALYCVIYINKNILNRSPIITFVKLNGVECPI